MRTERVYDGICRGEMASLMDRLKRYYGCGVWAGKLLLEFWYPRSGIDVARDWPKKEVVVKDGKDGSGIRVGRRGE